MTDLSPAACAVLKAACIHHGLFNEEVVQRRRMIAAALRAAADQAKGNPPDMKDELSVMYSCGWDDCVKQLLAIAAELENQ